jgi:threonine aldolase
LTEAKSRAVAFDFRSDTVTLPTPAMMQAIVRAPLGDAARGEDPSVNELECVAAMLTGKPEALFVPSGAMANLCALVAHDCRGGEVIVEAASHLYNAEGAGLSVVAGAMPRPIVGTRGVMPAAEVRRQIRSGSDLAIAPTRLLCVENTHNDSGGCVLPLDHLRELHAIAREADIPLHMDGARLFNAAACLGVSIGAICEHADSVWFALCKGLGCPVGAVLAGERGFMRRARRAAKMLGGGMRQSGLLAAAGLFALQDPYPQHWRDHALAQVLAQGLAAIDPTLVDPARVQTNIVNCQVDRHADDAGGIVRALAERGVLAGYKRSKIRFVTHAQLAPEAVDRAVRALAEILTQPPR